MNRCLRNVALAVLAIQAVKRVPMRTKVTVAAKVVDTAETAVQFCRDTATTVKRKAASIFSRKRKDNPQEGN